GATVDISLDAYPDRLFKARIRRIFPTADPATRLVPVEVALDEEANAYARPGFLARVRLALGTRSGVLLVPASAIVGDAGSPAVFVRSEEHTSELQSRENLVCRLLLEKKKTNERYVMTV